MKSTLSLFVFVVILSSVVLGQDQESPITHFLTKKGYVFPDSARKNTHSSKVTQWPDTLYYNTRYKAKLMGSLTIPISFTSIELTNSSVSNTNAATTNTSNSNIEVSPNISIGIGYTWFSGDFLFNENDKITVDPKVFFGVMASAGIDNSFLFNKLTSLSTGGFIGVSSFTFFLGYDFFNHTPSVAVGSRIDFYSISQKFLHILGRVHEVRKHKRIALPITRE